MELLDNIFIHWNTDSIINETEPSREIIRIPLLHSKYLRFLSDHNMAAKKAAMKYSAMKTLKGDYYDGVLTKEELDKNGWEPFVLKLSKTKRELYLEKDEDLVILIKKKIYHEEAVDVCKLILKELHNRTWQLREYMAHERFLQGN